MAPVAYEPADCRVGPARLQRGHRDAWDQDGCGVETDPVGCVGPRQILGADKPVTRGARSSRDRGSKRFGEPLAPPRFRPPYVRNHCYAAAHSGTS